MIALLDRINGWLHGVAQVGVWCGGVMMLTAAIVVSAEILLRKLFLVSLGGADELAGYALAVGTTWALSFALIQRAHIRVDALYFIISERKGAALDIVALLSLLVFASALTWFAAGVLQTSWNFAATANTPLGTPLWIPQGLWVLGFFLFWLTNFFLLLRTIAALFAGDLAQVARIAGTKSAKEEIEEEIPHDNRAAVAGKAGNAAISNWLRD